MLKISFAGGKADATDRQLARLLVRRADVARDERRYREAGALYAEATRLGDERAGVHVQAGHMFKEAGDLDAAEQHYNRALELLPEDADLALQMGHFYKVAGRLREAERSYRRALRIQPGWDVATREIAHLREVGLRTAAAPLEGEPIPFHPMSEAAALELDRTGSWETLAPEVMPRSLSERLHSNGESIHLRRLGRPERSRWGMQSTLRGVEAIRGFCLSRTLIVELQVLINGQLMHRGPVRRHPLKNEREDPRLLKYIFNVWLDFAGFLPGRYHIELRFRDVDGTVDREGGRKSHRQYVVIADPLPEPRLKGGDAWTPLTDPDDPRPVDEQINARASNIHSAKRAVFETPPRNILVCRTDQLGDVVISVPAFKRLRELFPEANLVALATSANADLIQTLGVFNEVIVIRFPDDPDQRKRVMTPEDQEELRRTLVPYRFDLAIDLAPAGESRPMLLLSGASFTAGFGDQAWSSMLSAGFDFNTHDPVARTDVMPASSKTLAFIESLAIMMESRAQVLRRPEIKRDRLEQFGIGAEERYVVLHTGARVVFSRWAHYSELAARLLEDPALKVVMLTEDPNTRAALPSTLAEHARFQLVDRRLAFDDFDALLSFCSVFVGNDSGPKHLASLRGSNVVSLHTPRVNWGEWGQELTGSIISRQVPCAGCHIYHDPEECGRDYVCISRISVDEVLQAMEPYLQSLPR